MQVLAGDVLQAADTFENFVSVWHRFGLLPERYLFASEQLHPTEQQYLLRPELVESNTYLYHVSTTTSASYGKKPAWCCLHFCHVCHWLSNGEQLDSLLLDSKPS